MDLNMLIVLINALVNINIIIIIIMKKKKKNAVNLANLLNGLKEN
jgi:hypothetical protein